MKLYPFSRADPRRKGYLVETMPTDTGSSKLPAHSAQADEVIAREWLLREVWEMDYMEDTRTLDRHGS